MSIASFVGKTVIVGLAAVGATAIGGMTALYIGNSRGSMRGVKRNKSTSHWTRRRKPAKPVRKNKATVHAETLTNKKTARKGKSKLRLVA